MPQYFEIIDLKLLLERGGELAGPDTLDKRQIGHIFDERVDLVALQLADEVPLNVAWQFVGFGTQLLHVVLAEVSLTRRRSTLNCRTPWLFF